MRVRVDFHKRSSIRVELTATAGQLLLFSNESGVNSRGKVVIQQTQGTPECVIHVRGIKLTSARPQVYSDLVVVTSAGEFTETVDPEAVVNEYIPCSTASILKI